MSEKVEAIRKAWKNTLHTGNGYADIVDRLADLSKLHPVGTLLDEYDKMKERQKWIDDVPRAKHPDDERPWASAYLDAMAEVERLKAENEVLEKELETKCGE